MSNQEINTEIFQEFLDSASERTLYAKARLGGIMLDAFAANMRAEEAERQTAELSEQLSLQTALAEEASILARRDQLTGLYNRLGFLEEGEQLLRIEDENGGLTINTNVVVFHIDLDKFKQVNDTQGHAAGDNLLKKAAAVLSKHVRAEDIVGRMGGDEFIIIADLTGEDELTINERSNRIVRRIKTEYLVETLESMSIGWVIADPTRHETIEDVIAEADTKMYQDKAGTNSVS